MPGHPLKDLTGETFGDLYVIDRAPNRNGQTVWRCMCSCGESREVYASALLQGRTKSCGHRRLERRPEGFNGRKVCTKCGESKPLEQFARKGKGDRRRGDCNACRDVPAKSKFERWWEVTRTQRVLSRMPWAGDGIREALS